MTLHGIIRLLAHRWKAKRLHGVHSPFVYRFSEMVLDSKDEPAIPAAVNSITSLPQKYKLLIARIIERYQYTTPVVTSNDMEEVPLAADMVLLTSDKPGNWLRIFNKYRSVHKNNSVFIVCGVHLTQRHTAKWRRLCKHPGVPMSIDLYGIGLLWFRPEFKEKQHFVLR